ncbi:MAG: DUF6754 domain-containing protein [candidate division WOR-3 bacterium]
MLPLIILINSSFSFFLAGDALSPSKVRARDNPNDGGKKILVEWELSPVDSLIFGYEIFRLAEGDTEEVKVGFVGAGRGSYLDETAEDGINYRYKVVALLDSLRAESQFSNFAKSSPQWFNLNKISVVLFFIVFGFLILFWTEKAKKRKDLYVRKISGLSAVEEAVGRATEMGKPVLFVPGLTGMSDVATIAAMNILSCVAEKIAQYSSKLIVPNVDPIVFTVAREVVKEAYTAAGRPDAFSPDSVFYVTDSQFAFAAAVDGIMVRERPATNFFCGYFYAESLILAETGASTGAIQIAATDAVMQLPFFITACDYTLMGEELYAASAYLSREPLLLGALKGQDYGKLIIMGLLILLSLIALLTKMPVLKLL